MSPGARLGDGHNECRCCTLTREGRVRKLAALGAMLNQVPPTQLRSPRSGRIEVGKIVLEGHIEEMMSNDSVRGAFSD